jgi:hypothetical protein
MRLEYQQMCWCMMTVIPEFRKLRWDDGEFLAILDYIGTTTNTSIPCRKQRNKTKIREQNDLSFKSANFSLAAQVLLRDFVTVFMELTSGRKKH